MAAHDLRSPLTTADAFLAFAEEGGGLSTQTMDFLGNARNYGEPPVCVSAAVDGDDIIVTVSDAGAGIAAVEQLFEPFVRGPNDPTIAGSGLGLAAARTLARLNGGDLRSAPERPTTTFELRLPRATV